MNTIPPCMDRYRFVANNQPITPPPPTSPGCHQKSRFWDVDCPISKSYSSSQSYHVGYQGPQRLVHPQNGPQQYPIVGCYANTASANWTGVPLISTAQRRPRKYNNNNVNNNNNNNSNNEFDENAMSRLARHAHGAPLIVANRYRTVNGGKPNHHNKTKTTINNLQQKEEILKLNCNNNKSDSMSVTSDESSVSSAGSHNSTATNLSSTEQLPRIIKPRKRRKKDRKPNMTSSNNCNNVTDNKIGMADNNKVLEVNNNNEQTINNNKKSSFNDDKEELFGNTGTPPLTSSCSCRLCNPFSKIWAFPLRRSCSDNSAEIELKKDVGVIGSHRHGLTRNEWRSSPQSLDLMMQPTIESSNSSDSGDSGCDLLLGGLNFNDCSDFMISDLTKKLNESFDLKSESEDSGGCSAFSEGKNANNAKKNCDFFVNFDTMSRNNLFNVNNICNLGNLLFDDTIVAHGLLPNAMQELNFFSENDTKRTNGTSNLIWSETKLLPAEE